MNDLCYVLDELLDVRHKWFNLGLMLQLNVGTLECVRNQYPDSSSALREMLLSWLKKVDPPPTWEGLACALESRTVGEPRLAEQLRTNHCKTEVSYSTLLRPRGCVLVFKTGRTVLCMSVNTHSHFHVKFLPIYAPAYHSLVANIDTSNGTLQKSEQLHNLHSDYNAIAHTHSFAISDLLA